MEHIAEYTEGLYRVVEQIEKVKGGYEWRVTAYDDETARELPWHPEHVIRFEAKGLAPTLKDAHKNLSASVLLMKTRIAKDML